MVDKFVSPEGPKKYIPPRQDVKAEGIIWLIKG